MAAVDCALAHGGLRQGTVAVRQLIGGTHATTWLVANEGLGIEAVLREFPADDASVVWEAHVLRKLDGLGGLAPQLLAEGVDDPIPWLLLSRLRGSADITSGEPEAVAAELGVALARVHRVDSDRLTAFRKVYEMPGKEMQGKEMQVLSGPAASTVGACWQRILDEPLVLTHYDYWSGNVVWDAHRLSGIVDWNGGSLGPRGFDVGWCRLDLYLLYDAEIADVFLYSYEAAFGEVLADPAMWDLWAVARSDHAVDTWVRNYSDLRRVDLTAAALRTRHREWTDNSLERAQR
jgi:aminoglycoside phosphotransferase (APT) family kinase protein